MSLRVQLFLDRTLASKVLAEAERQQKSVPAILLEALRVYFGTSPPHTHQQLSSGEEKPLATETNENTVIKWRDCAYHTRHYTNGGLWCSRRKKYLSATLSECQGCKYFKLPPLPQIHP